MKRIILKYQDFLNEANRGNYYPNSKEEFYKFINKYKGQEDLIFLSFKSSDKFVSKIKIDYEFWTPQGLYTYPYKNYVENLIDDSKFLKIDVPFANDKRFLYIYKLKSLDGFLTFQNEQDYPKALKVIERIKQDYDISEKEYQNTISQYKSGNKSFDIENPVSIIYSLVCIEISENNAKLQRNVFLEYGILGFIDNGGGFIDNGVRFVTDIIETQASIFNPSIIEDYIIIDRGRDAKYKFKDFTPEQKRVLENPKTIEDFKHISDFFKLYLSVKDIEIGSDGLWSYNGSINLRYGEFVEVPKFLKNMKEVKELIFYGCSNLKSLDGLKNLKKVGTLDLEGCYELDGEYIENFLRNVKISEVITDLDYEMDLDYEEEE